MNIIIYKNITDLMAQNGMPMSNETIMRVQRGAEYMDIRIVDDVIRLLSTSEIRVMPVAENNIIVRF